MLCRPAVFGKVNSESVIFNRKALHKKVDYPDFTIMVNGLVQRNRKKVDLGSVMSLYEFHVVKIQNSQFLQESPAS